MASPPSSPPHPKKPKLSPTTTTNNNNPDEIPEAREHQRPPLPPPPSSSSSSGKPRYKRRKIALFFGYCGFGYQGMQKNPGAKTIEADLEEALFRSWAVPESGRGCPRRCDWSRSARTDKGVSAIGQVVSGRFYIDPPGLVERLNSHLDPKIRVFGFKRVTASFNAKKFCDRRRYVYMLPAFALDSGRHGGSGVEGECGDCGGNGYRAVGGRGVPISELEEREQLGSGDGGDLEMVERNGVVGDSNLESGLCLAGEKSELGNGEGEFGELNGSSSVSDAKSLFVEEQETTARHENGSVSVAEMEASEKLNAVVTSIDDCGNVVASENKMETVSMENQSGEQNGGLSVSDTGLLVSEGEGMTANHEHGDIATPEIEASGGVENGEVSVLDSGNEHQVPATSSKFCFGEDEKNRFNNILKRYVGTHNFHNFTSRTKAEDPSALRYIVSFQANTVVNLQGTEFVKCEVVGQSFMLHQIRKMIGLAVAIMRSCTSESLMDSAFSKDVNVNVPTAPEIGLYLDECLFTSYNKKWKDHEELSMDSFANEAEDFEMKHIYSHIASMEQQEGAVALWLHTLNYHRYHDLHSLEVN